MDLIFLIGRLKAVGLLAETTTDADVIAHFDFGSKAKDMAKNYRNLRRQLRMGASFPDREKFDALIERLRESG